MEYSLKHPYNLDPANGVEIKDDVIRLRWSEKSGLFSRNTFVTINIVGSKRKAYRILKGASNERISGSEVLVSYSTYKYIGGNKNSRLNIVKSNMWERNVLFYFNNPDPRMRHKIVRDFVVTAAGFILSIVGILEYFGI
jgi:hypothetical protein